MHLYRCDVSEGCDVLYCIDGMPKMSPRDRGESMENMYGTRQRFRFYFQRLYIQGYPWKARSENRENFDPKLTVVYEYMYVQLSHRLFNP